MKLPEPIIHIGTIVLAYVEDKGFFYGQIARTPGATNYSYGVSSGSEVISVKPSYISESLDIDSMYNLILIDVESIPYFGEGINAGAQKRNKLEKALAELPNEFRLSLRDND